MNKKSLLFSALALFLGVASCTSEESVKDLEGNDLETNFLSVSLVPAPDMTSRAEGNQTPGDPNNGATYEEGYKSENTVKKVRFYFFDSSGNAAPIKSDNTNYYDWNAEDNNTQNTPNVEKQLKAIVVINTKDDSGLPDKVVAILNPEVENLGAGNLSLSQLLAKANDYAGTVNGTKPQNFIMTNSVYANGNTEIIATPIDEKNYSSSREGAQQNSLNIYVERCVAKVRVKLGNNLGYDQTRKRLPLKDDTGNNIKVGGKDVYLQLGTWNLTADTDRGNLLKDIDPVNWTSDAMGSFYWNWNPYFRSFWATNAVGAQQHWYAYNEIAKGGKLFDGTLANSIYANENAPQHALTTNAGDYTKVIIAGTLVDSEGKYIEVSKYAGVSYPDKGTLKTAMLNALGTNTIYSYSTTGNATTFNKLSEDDVEFKTALDANINGVTASESTTGRYNVYLQLSQIGLAKQWSKSNNSATLTNDRFENTQAVNTYLINNLGRAQIYSKGQTYYYFPIKHLGDKGKTAEYGVVRNHIYDCTITALTGLGTPVYDPEQDIYPEHPVDDETYIAAQINILSWRLVTQDIELNW